MPPTEPCNVHTDRPQAPQNLSYTTSNGTVTLQWTKPGGMALKGYLVYRQMKGETVFKQLTVEPVNKTSYADENIQEEKTYTYKVISVSTQETLSPEASITVEVPKEQIFTLTVTDKQGGNQHCTTNPAPGTYTYNEGTEVTLSASVAPPASNNYEFEKWIVNNTTYTDATIKLIMNENITAVARFKEKQSNSTTLDWLSIFRRYLAMF